MIRCRQRGLNPRPSVYKTAALPLSYGGVPERLENESPNEMSKPVQTTADFCGTQPITRRLLYH